MPPTPAPTSRQRLDSLAQTIQDTFGTSAENLGTIEDDPIAHTLAGFWNDLLQRAEDVAVTRARLTSRPHPPERAEKLNRQLQAQTRRLAYRFRVVADLTGTRAGSTPRRGTLHGSDSTAA